MRKFVAALVLSVSCVQPVQAIDPATQAVALQALSTLSSVLSITKWFNNSKQVGYVITVRGDGRNLNEAQNNAYLRAVDEAVGAYVGSHTEVRNGEVVRHDIVKHVTGYVNKYEILEQGNNYVVMKVWVADANIARGLLPVHMVDGKIDGNQVTVQINTLDASNQGATDLINSVGKSGQSGAAFKLKTGNAKLVNTNTGWTTQIRVEVKWNHDYLISVIRMAERVKASEPGFWDNVVNELGKAGTTCNQGVSAHDCRSARERLDIRDLLVITRKEGDFLGRQNVIGLEADRWETMAQALPNSVIARVTVIGNSRGVVYDKCEYLGSGMVQVGSRTITVNGNDTINTNIVLPALRDDQYQVKINFTCS